jgi:hypothetical protein
MPCRHFTRGIWVGDETQTALELMGTEDISLQSQRNVHTGRLHLEIQTAVGLILCIMVAHGVVIFHVASLLHDGRMYLENGRMICGWHASFLYKRIGS